MSLSSILSLLGFITLLHALYSAHHFKSLFSQAIDLPIDIIIEVAIAFILILIGQSLPMKLKPVRISADVIIKTVNEIYGRPEFITFNNNRSKQIYNRKLKALKK